MERGRLQEKRRLTVDAAPGPWVWGAILTGSFERLTAQLSAVLSVRALKSSVLDVEGETVVIDATYAPDAPQRVRDELAAIVQTLEFETR